MLIRKLFRFLSRPVTCVVPLEKLISLSGQKRILPFYHSISDQPLPHLKQVLKIRNSETFGQDLDFLLTHYEPVDARQLLDGVNGKRALSRPHFHLTFDDGLKECITVIAPILKRKGIPATFFINTGFIGNKELFFRYKASLLADKTPTLSPLQEKEIHQIMDARQLPPGNTHKRLLSVAYAQKDILEDIAGIMEIDFKGYATKQEVYMSHEDIETLQKSGFTIGSHGIDHPLFRTVSEKEQQRQVRSSMEFLKENFAVSPLLFSFPFSDEGVSADFFNHLYLPEGMTELSFGISGLKKETFPFHLHRISMETGSDSARHILYGEYLWYISKSVFGKNTIRRK